MSAEYRALHAMFFRRIPSVLGLKCEMPKRTRIDSGEAFTTPESRLVLLTERERRLLGLLSRGYSNKKAATELSIGLRSVERARRAITSKLGVDSVIEAAIVNAIEEFKQASERSGDV